jgi:nitrogen fixation protein FixH
MPARPSDKYIPWTFVGFFACLTLLFAWFAYIAHITYPGVVTDEPYDKGIAYNKIIAAAEAGQALGWKLSLDAAAAFGGRTVFRLRAADRDGRPVTGGAARLWLTRPVHGGIDLHLVMAERANGVYEVSAPLAEPGLWELRAEIRKDGRSIQVSRRMELTP